MRGQRQINAEKHRAGSLGWRRIWVLTRLAFVWLMVMWLVWCFPTIRRHGRSVRATYGIFQWYEWQGTRRQARAIGGLFPRLILGRHRVNPVPLTVSIIISAGSTALVVVVTRRWLRNLTPRWKCQRCGHVVSEGFPRSNVCSECGELPNLQKNPWAFWS
jgi:hypothetical protein